jgi:hypothetical protein
MVKQVLNVIALTLLITFTTPKIDQMYFLFDSTPYTDVLKLQVAMHKLQTVKTLNTLYKLSH